MKKSFIKFTTFIVIAFFTSNAIAQSEQGDKELGVDFNLGIGVGEYAPNTLFGAGIKGRFTVLDNLRLEVNMSYMFISETYEISEGGNVSSETYNWALIELCPNIHYIFEPLDGLFLYPLAGLGFAGATESGGGSAQISSLVLNAGAGAQYMFNDKWGANLEAKYKRITGDDAFSYINLAFGVVYKF